MAEYPKYYYLLPVEKRSRVIVGDVWDGFGLPPTRILA